MAPVLLALVLLSPEPKLSVTGAVSHGRSFTADELRSTFAKEIRDVSFSEKGVAGHAHAFPLIELVRMAEPKLDPLRKHADFSLALVAIGPDGYSATFSFAELAPELGHRNVWVALDWNDHPLTGDDAPVRLMVQGDDKPSRWVHGVRTLRLVNLAPKGHGPAPEGGPSHEAAPPAQGRGRG